MDTPRRPVDPTGGVQLRVNGRWLSHIAGWGELTWSTRRTGGDYEISWAMNPGLRSRFPDNALVEVMDGPVPLCAGQLQEPPSGVDDQDGTYTAQGLSRVAETYQGLDGAGNASTTIRAVIDAAIARGWRVTRHTSVPAMTLSDSTASAGLTSVAALLDAAATEAGMTWGVGPNRTVRFTTDPTAPTWYLRPGLVDLAPASEDFARTVIVRYVNTSGTRANAIAGSGAPERPEDLTPLGPMTATRAQAYAVSLLAQVQRPGWTGGLDVAAGELTTPGGQPADLRRVRGGQVVRLHGLADDAIALAGRTYLDVVLGETSHQAGSGLVTISPVNAAASTWLTNLQKALAR